MPRNKQKNLARAAAHRAEKAGQQRFERKIEAALSGCSDRVLKAVNAPSARSKPQPSADNISLGDVAIYNAGFRKKTETVTAR